MSELVEALAIVTRRPADEISKAMTGEPIDLGSRNAGIVIRDKLADVGLPFAFISHGIPPNPGTNGGLARLLLKEQTDILRQYLVTESPQALLLICDERKPRPLSRWSQERPPHHEVKVAAYVDGQVIDPQHPKHPSDLEEIEHIFGALVFTGEYSDAVAAQPITDIQPQP